MTKNIITKIETNSSNIQNKLSPLKNKINSKVLVPVMSADKNSEVSKHFGHAPFFAIFDTLSKELIFEKNTLIHDDPISSAVDQVIEKFNPGEVFVDNIGKKALDLFEKNGIKVHALTTKKLNEIIEPKIND